MVSTSITASTMAKSAKLNLPVGVFIIIGHSAWAQNHTESAFRFYATISTDATSGITLYNMADSFGMGGWAEVAPSAIAITTATTEVYLNLTCTSSGTASSNRITGVRIK